MMNTRLYDLVALDMDGTLLNSDHVTTPFTREALRRADEAGKVVALCTGRCLSELWEHLRAMTSISYAIIESGGSVYDVRNDRILRQSVIENVMAERLFALAEPRDVMLQCFFGNQSYIQLKHYNDLAHWHMAAFRTAFESGSVFTPDIRALWRSSGQPLTKFNLYFASEAEKDRFSQAMGTPELYVAGCMGIGYELSPKGAGKDDGLRALCDYLDIPVERAMAVGDGDNDLELMATAGFAVAMGNAVPAVLRLADAVTDDCDHDGAAKAVLKYLLGEA